MEINMSLWRHCGWYTLYMNAAEALYADITAQT
jgi:hypothetical protein